MGNFITGNTPIPPAFVDGNPPSGLLGELDAGHINAIWGAISDLRNHVSGYLHTYDFPGVDPTGTNDSSAGIQACVTQALAQGKGVDLGAGTFRVDSTIIAGSSITIKGWGRFTTLKPTISDGSPVISFPPGSLYFRCQDFWIISPINGTNFNAGTQQALQCTGIKIAANVAGSVYSSRFSLSNLHAFGLKIGYDVQGFICTCDNLWADYNEIGFKGDTLNTADLNLRLENNRQDFAITGSGAVLLRNVIMEGLNTLGVPSTLDTVRGCMMLCPYMEAGAAAPRTQPWLVVGGVTTCYDFKLLCGSVYGGSGMAAGVYPIKLDNVIGAEINCHFGDAAQTRKVLTTANTKDYRITGDSDFDWFTDESGQIGSLLNYFPNGGFELWWRGWSQAFPQRATRTQETAIVRRGGSAMRVTATAGLNFNYAFCAIGGPSVVSLRGKTIRLGAWIWVPNLTEYDETNRTAFPTIAISSFNGSVENLTNAATNATGRNAWNYIYVQITVQADATRIGAWFYANDSSILATGNEFIVVDDVSIVDVNTPISKQMNGEFTNATTIYSTSVNGSMVAYDSGPPTDVNQIYVAGDIVFNNAPLAGEPSAWLCIVGGSPGTWRPIGYIESVSADRGDAAVTLVVGVDARTQRFATTLTANRVVTLSTAGAFDGDKFRVVRTGLGAFTLDVGGLKTIPSATAAFVDVAYDGTAWRLIGYGLL